MKPRSVREIHREHLRDPRVASRYLREVLKEGNKAFLRMALSEVAEAQKGGLSGDKATGYDKAITNAPSHPSSPRTRTLG